jgi:hypothetical protein
MKYVIIPLTPFIIGACIRLLESESASWSALDPAELSFSLAMFCLLGNISARRLEKSQYREAIAGVFVVGAVLFISLFAYSVLKSQQLDNLERSSIERILRQVTESGTLARIDIEEMVEHAATATILQRLNLVLGIVSSVGLIYVCMGLGFRHIYGLGDEE